MDPTLERGATILVVEDDEGVAGAIREVLLRAGYDVPATVSTSTGSLALAASTSPALVLMDIGLRGGVDGIETARKLRDVAPEARVLYITGADDEATLRRAQATSPIGYVRKPVTPPLLRLTVEIALQQAHRERTIADRERRLGMAERLAAIGTMAAGIQHEINNPLASIVANVQFVRDVLSSREDEAPHVPEPEELLAALDDASHGAERVRRTVEELRLFSHADDDDEAVIDLAKALDEAARLTDHEVKHFAEVKRDYRPTPPVQASAGKLTRAFMNILLHAAHAAGSRTTPTTLYASTYTDARGRAVAEIRDDGPGLPKGVEHRIFDPFFPSRTSETVTGLGLAVSRSIVTAMGGEIEAFGAEGRGTTVRIALPAGPADAEELVRARRTKAPPAPATTKARVLVIDDELAIGKALRRVVGDEHQIEVEDDAEVALARLEREAFDVIFCDLMMPRMSGMDVHASLVGRDPTSAQRMVFMTGGAVSVRAQEFMQTTAHRLLLKPFTRQSVCEAIRRVLADT